MSNGSVLFRRLAHQFRQYATFKEGDSALVQSLKQQRYDAYLSKPLSQNGKLNHRGTDIRHSEIIGKSSRDTITASNGASYRVLEPTLGEYVCLTKRLVTPIYPSNTNLIVSLLNIHPPLEDDEIHILEAGTGHGALTLHLARAIHGSNPPAPSTADEASLAEWKTERKAVLHTLDVSPAHSAHAATIVKGFRRGVYASHVDFHVGDVPAFLASLAPGMRSERFLTHVVLDMPNADERLRAVAERMRNDAILLVFNPSVTQIAQCVERIAEEGLPLYLENVMELAGAMSGGREWDVRIAKVKKPANPVAVEVTKETETAGGFWSWVSGLWGNSKSVSTTPAKPLEKNVMVCRPKAGYQVPVGGFVGVWRRKASTEMDG